MFRFFVGLMLVMIFLSSPNAHDISKACHMTETQQGE